MEHNVNINWEEVEMKISIICNKFSNISEYKEDLAQELRIHAYYASDNYYDLYRKAIDFWRMIQRKHNPESPYFDLDVLGMSTKSNASEMVSFDEVIEEIKRELNRPGVNKPEDKRLELARELLDIIIEGVDPRKPIKTRGKSKLNPYFNQKINISWVSEETGIPYKRLEAAMRIIEDTVQGLALMGRIELPYEYFKGYFDK